jgi:hypothetical protein
MKDLDLVWSLLLFVCSICILELDKKNVDLTSWAITFLHGMAWIATHYDKKTIACGWITNGDCIKYSISDCA